MNAVVRPNPLFLHLSVPIAASAISAYLCGNIFTAYSTLILPRYAPPVWLIAVIWFLLNMLMGAASYCIKSDEYLSHSDKRSATTLYIFSLLASCVWPVMFFHFNLITLSACWVPVALITTLLCAATFHRMRPLAGRMLIPSVVWLIFACILNINIAVLN